MKARIEEDGVVVGDARQRLYDSGGYGEPRESGDTVDLSFVEAAYLLGRDKLSSVDGMDYLDLVRYASGAPGFLPTLTVYSDLRERGYYLQHEPGETTVSVYPRGVKPIEGEPEHRAAVVTEHGSISLAVERGLYGVVDDDLDVTYLRLTEWSEEGDVSTPEGVFEAEDIEGRAVLGDTSLYEGAFYGSRLEDHLVLSLQETAYLSERGVVEGAEGEPDPVYGDLRDRGLCPRSGLKFGTTYRVYREFSGLDDLGHAPYLLDRTSAEVPVREVARAVRLAHGVRKTMVFAVDGGYVEASHFRP